MRSKFSPVAWVYFVLFLAANSLLAFGSFSLSTKLWLGLAGIVVPLVFLINSPGPMAERIVSGKPSEIFATIPTWLWRSVLGLAVFLRFFKLDSLSIWPNMDESSFAMIAVRLAQNWDWRFFYGHSQNVFPFYWSLALLFKLFGPSLMALWLYPALLSCLALPLAWLAARQYFPRDLSFLLWVLFAFSYWNLFAGRIAMFTALVPCAELLALYALGRFLNAPASRKGGAAVFLALGLVLGFYVYPLSWIPLALLLSMIAAVHLQRSGPVRPIPFIVFGGTLTFFLSPFACAVLKDYGSYLHSIAATPHRFLTSLAYVTGLFWGKIPGDYYGPEWGGFLDPLSGALCFLGWGCCLAERKKPFGLAVTGAVVACLLPGVLSSTLEYFRIFLVLPFLLYFCARGLQALLTDFPSEWRTTTLALLFYAFVGLNGYHLFGPYQARWKSPGESWEGYKNTEGYRAFDYLQNTAKTLGPGFIFTDFGVDMFDHSLFLASCPFNDLGKTHAPKGRPQWCAVVTNENYRPFLQTRFPSGAWIPLSTGLDRVDGGMVLGLFSKNEMDEKTFQKWAEAGKAFQWVSYVFLNRPTGTGYADVIKALNAVHPMMEGDPFLESCYWEKLYDLSLQNRAFGDKRVSDNLAASLQTIQAALQYGYPAAHLYNELGSYLLWMGRKSEAKRAFEDALKANPAFEPARENLAQLH